MLTIYIIATFSGILSIFWIIKEISESLDNLERRYNSLTGIKKLAMIWLWFPECMPIVSDVAITLFVVWLFSMSGQSGMVIALMSSGMISTFLYFRRKKKNKLATCHN